MATLHQWLCHNCEKGLPYGNQIVVSSNKFGNRTVRETILNPQFAVQNKWSGKAGGCRDLLGSVWWQKGRGWTSEWLSSYQGPCGLCIDGLILLFYCAVPPSLTWLLIRRHILAITGCPSLPSGNDRLVKGPRFQDMKTPPKWQGPCHTLHHFLDTVFMRRTWLLAAMIVQQVIAELRLINGQLSLVLWVLCKQSLQ